MIAIINYGQNVPAKLKEALSSLNIENTFTENETEIAQAKKVIFHSDDSPEALLRMLHFQNLFSLLRICCKPLLAIGTAFSACGEKIINSKKVGLGLIPQEVSILEEEISGLFNVRIEKENSLFSGIEDMQFSFASKLFIPKADSTIASVTINEVKYSAALQIGKLTGLQFFPEKSGDAGKIVLNNWYKS